MTDPRLFYCWCTKRYFFLLNFFVGWSLANQLYVYAYILIYIHLCLSHTHIHTYIHVWSNFILKDTDHRVMFYWHSFTYQFMHTYHSIHYLHSLQWHLCVGHQTSNASHTHKNKNWSTAIQVGVFTISKLFSYFPMIYIYILKSSQTLRQVLYFWQQWLITITVT